MFWEGHSVYSHHCVGRVVLWADRPVLGGGGGGMPAFPDPQLCHCVGRVMLWADRPVMGGGGGGMPAFPDPQLCLP